MKKTEILVEATRNPDKNSEWDKLGEFVRLNAGDGFVEACYKYLLRAGMPKLSPGQKITLLVSIKRAPKGAKVKFTNVVV